MKFISALSLLGCSRLPRLFLITLVLVSGARSAAATAASARLLYVHGAVGSQDAGDPDIIRLLTEDLGCVVTKRFDAAQPDAKADARGFDLVFISSSVFSKNVAGKYRDHAIPVIVGEALTFPDEWMAMARKSHFEGKAPHLDAVRLVAGAAGHPLAAGNAPGLLPVSDGKAAIWGWGGELGAGGKVIAVATVNPASGAVPADEAIVEFVYEKGATLTDGTAAKGLRIGIPWIDSEGPIFGERPNSISDDGRALLRSAVSYALTHH